MDSELAYTGPVVVFDLDDTLYKELDFLKSGFHAVAEYAASQTDEDAQTLYADMMEARSNGLNAFDMLASRYFGSSEYFIGKAVEIYRFHKPAISLRPEAQPLLEALARKGLRLGIITDGRAATQHKKIEALGIARYFAPQNILISEEINAEKTAPLAWQTIVRRYPNASRFVYVGDNPAKDFRTPNLLGWLTLGLTDPDGDNIHPQEPLPSPQHAPQAWISSLQEVSNHLN